MGDLPDKTRASAAPERTNDKAGRQALPTPELIKCPHCGRRVQPREPDAASSVRTCPACGLPIKDEHLA